MISKINDLKFSTNNKSNATDAASDYKIAKAKKISSALKALNQGFGEQRVAQKAKELGFQYFNLTKFPIDNSAVTLLTEKQVRDAEAIPFYRDAQNLKMGMVNPANPAVNDLVEFLSKKNYKVDLYLISSAGFEKGVAVYKSIKPPKITQEQIRIYKEKPELQVDKLKELEKMGEEILKISATDFISTLLTAATSVRASDIHLQPEKDFLQIRFRVDGVLQEAARLNSIIYKSLISRIKILSKLKINVTKVPQDGSFVISAGFHQYEIRVSLLPSTYGEAVVMRLLGEQVALEVKDIGMRALAFERIQAEIKKPNGLILTTGPTGSGKTTTLYSFLKNVNKPGVKIITLENPVEYRLEGVEQIQIDKKAGLTFATALKSTLRQDPDILMVGEIRDSDTAEAAAQAALTGHLVFSTIHTNDSSGAIPRLLNLGIQPVVLAPALTAVIAQRLVRKICPDCREEQSLDKQTRERVETILAEVPANAKVEIPKDKKFYHGKGCHNCNGLGYKGRIGVFEAFNMDDDMQKLVFQNASTVEIKRTAIKNGMVTMIQDGLLKALDGITDVQEVFRVTEE